MRKKSKQIGWFCIANWYELCQEDPDANEHACGNTALPVKYYRPLLPVAGNTGADTLSGTGLLCTAIRPDGSVGIRYRWLICLNERTYSLASAG